MRFFQTFTRWLFILCVPVLLLTAIIAVGANSLLLYTYGYQTYNVGQRLANVGLELSDSDLERIYADLISYYNSSKEYVSIKVIRDGESIDLFTPEETIHFKDVKSMIRFDYMVLSGTLAFTLAYGGASLLWWRDHRKLAWGMVGGNSLTLGLILTLIFLNSFVSFNQLFYQFHLMFFNNEFWSAQGYMLQLFPVEFFYDAATFGVLAIIAGALLMGGAGGYLLLRHTWLVNKENHQ